MLPATSGCASASIEEAEPVGLLGLCWRPPAARAYQHQQREVRVVRVEDSRLTQGGRARLAAVRRRCSRWSAPATMQHERATPPCRSPATSRSTSSVAGVLGSDGEQDGPRPDVVVGVSRAGRRRSVAVSPPIACSAHSARSFQVHVLGRPSAASAARRRSPSPASRPRRAPAAPAGPAARTSRSACSCSFTSSASVSFDTSPFHGFGVAVHDAVDAAVGRVGHVVVVALAGVAPVADVQPAVRAVLHADAAEPRVVGEQEVRRRARRRSPLLVRSRPSWLSRLPWMLQVNSVLRYSAGKLSPR